MAAMDPLLAGVLLLALAWLWKRRMHRQRDPLLRVRAYRRRIEEFRRTQEICVVSTAIVANRSCRTDRVLPS